MSENYVHTYICTLTSSLDSLDYVSGCDPTYIHNIFMQVANIIKHIMASVVALLCMYIVSKKLIITSIYIDLVLVTSIYYIDLVLDSTHTCRYMYICTDTLIHIDTDLDTHTHAHT